MVDCPPFVILQSVVAVALVECVALWITARGQQSYAA